MKITKFKETERITKQGNYQGLESDSISTYPGVSSTLYSFLTLKIIYSKLNYTGTASLSDINVKLLYNQ